MLSGAPAAVTVSDTQGKFKLEGIPAGVNVPLVFQVGKWRREVTIPNVVACTDTRLTDANLTRLPRNHDEGHIPRIAMSTGGSDALECFLLWSNPTKLAGYDMLGFSCEGSTSEYVDQKPQSSVDNIVAYANSGGRLLFGHLHIYWLQHATDFAGTASYVGNLSNPPSPVVMTVNQTPPGGKGQALAQWLAGPVVAASATLGQISISGAQHSVTSVNPPTTEWIYLASNPNDSTQRRSAQLFSFQTPVGMPEANQCGKVAFADMHIGVSSDAAGGDTGGLNRPFPSGCKTNASSAQMNALEFVFFDLGACL